MALRPCLLSELDERVQMQGNVSTMPFLLSIRRDGRVVQWCFVQVHVNFQCRGVLQIWIIVGQGPTALAVGVG